MKTIRLWARLSWDDLAVLDRQKIGVSELFHYEMARLETAHLEGDGLELAEDLRGWAAALRPVPRGDAIPIRIWASLDEFALMKWYQLNAREILRALVYKIACAAALRS